MKVTFNYYGSIAYSFEVIYYDSTAYSFQSFFFDSAAGGRLECTMQNIADDFMNTYNYRCSKGIESM